MRSFSFTDFLKRALPFFAALVIGVFIASFFVDLSRPRFGRGPHFHQSYRDLKQENQEQKNQIDQLTRDLENGSLTFCEKVLLERYRERYDRDGNLREPNSRKGRDDLFNFGCGSGTGTGTGSERYATDSMPAGSIDELPGSPLPVYADPPGGAIRKKHNHH